VVAGYVALQSPYSRDRQILSCCITSQKIQGKNSEINFLPFDRYDLNFRLLCLFVAVAQK